MTLAQQFWLPKYASTGTATGSYSTKDVADIPGDGIKMWARSGNYKPASSASRWSIIEVDETEFEELQNRLEREIHFTFKREHDKRFHSSKGLINVIF